MGWLNNHSPVREITLGLFFGVLSLIFNAIVQINLPGISEASSDFREIPLIMGVFFYRKWFPIAVSCVITTFTFYNYGPDVYVSVFINHFIALLSAWYFYRYLRKLNLSYTLLAISWSGMAIVYYVVFLFPLLSAYEIFYLRDTTPFFKHLGALIDVGKVEVILTTLITSSFSVALETRRKLEEANDNLELVVNQ
ncbi:MAG: hypothetical protein AAFN93_25805, partial [Bacteroidota bacterium]